MFYLTVLPSTCILSGDVKRRGVLMGNLNLAVVMFKKGFSASLGKEWASVQLQLFQGFHGTPETLLINTKCLESFWIYISRPVSSQHRSTLVFTRVTMELWMSLTRKDKDAVPASCLRNENERDLTSFSCTCAEPDWKNTLCWIKVWLGRRHSATGEKGEGCDAVG